MTAMLGTSWEIVSDLWPESSWIGFTAIKLTDWALCLQETFCCCVVQGPRWAILCPFIVYSLCVGTGLSDGGTGWARLHCHANDTQIYILPQTNIHCDVSIRSPLMDNNFFQDYSLLWKCKLNRSPINGISIVFKCCQLFSCIVVFQGQVLLSALMVVISDCSANNLFIDK